MTKHGKDYIEDIVKIHSIKIAIEEEEHPCLCISREKHPNNSERGQ